MSQTDSEQIEPIAEFPTIVFARRCKLQPELLSRWEDMRVFLKLRENRDRINQLWDIAECVDPDYIDENELADIKDQLRDVAEAIFDI
ncbi:MAG: hypothetical protein QW505_05290 [Thermoplasmata archaeon]